MTLTLSLDILHDPHQVLYRPCSFGDGSCSEPVASSEDIHCCPLHQRLNTSHDSTFGNDSKVGYIHFSELRGRVVDMEIEVSILALTSQYQNILSSETPANMSFQVELSTREVKKDMYALDSFNNEG